MFHSSIETGINYVEPLERVSTAMELILSTDHMFTALFDTGKNMECKNMVISFEGEDL